MNSFVFQCVFLCVLELKFKVVCFRVNTSFIIFNTNDLPAFLHTRLY